jgi:hypothetical protein
MRKTLAFLLIIAIVLSAAGCASVQKKFTRKKKETVKMPRIYQVKKYELAPTPELYKKHYVYWESFQSEMIMTLAQNHKKNMICIEHILSNLEDMRNMLLPEKAAELEVHIERLEKIRDILAKEDLTTFNKQYVTMTLERESRYIKRGFVYKKVKDSLRTSFEEGPKEAALESKPQEVTDDQARPKAE